MKKKFALSVSVVLLLIMVVLTCVACTPNSDSLKKKLKKNDYEVVVVEISSNLGDEYATMGATKVLTATKGEGEDMDFVVVLWFSDSKKCDEFYEQAKKEYDEEKKACEEAGEDYDIKLVKKGKAVINGTKAAVKIIA